MDLTKEIAKIQITGDTTHPNWFKILLKENGKPDLLACHLLANIIDAYKPIYVRDEKTGLSLPPRKKFTGDILQRDYKEYASYYGTTASETKRAFDTLERKGVVTREFRQKDALGRPASNKMYVAPNPKRIMEITHGNCEDAENFTLKGVVKQEPKKKREVEQYGPLVQKILNYLSEMRSKAYRRSMRGYKATDGKNMRLVVARLKEGFTEEDFYTVIDSKYREWNKSEMMRAYLRPETLFKASHFSEYLASAPKAKAKSQIDRDIEGLVG